MVLVGPVAEPLLACTSFMQAPLDSLASSAQKWPGGSGLAVTCRNPSKFTCGPVTKGLVGMVMTPGCSSFDSTSGCSFRLTSPSQPKEQGFKVLMVTVPK